MDTQNTPTPGEPALRMRNVDPNDLPRINGGFFFLAAFLPGMAAGYFGTKAIMDQQPKLGSALKNIVPR